MSSRGPPAARRTGTELKINIPLTGRISVLLDSSIPR
jgi:hypothetical protein